VKKVRNQKLKVERHQKQSVPEKERPHRKTDAAFRKTESYQF